MILQKIAQHQLNWQSLPDSISGETQLFDPQEQLMKPVRWKLDSQGIQIWFADKALEYDISSRRDDEGRLVYDLTERSNGHIWREILLAPVDHSVQENVGSQKVKRVRVRAQMPGRVIRLLVKKGDSVQKGQTILVLEAMKMENELRATVDGIVTDVKVVEGSNVDTGAELLILNG